MSSTPNIESNLLAYNPTEPPLFMRRRPDSIIIPKEKCNFLLL